MADDVCFRAKPSSDIHYGSVVTYIVNQDLSGVNATRAIPHCTGNLDTVLYNRLNDRGDDYNYYSA